MKISYATKTVIEGNGRMAVRDAEVIAVPRIGEDVEYAEDWPPQEVQWIRHCLDGEILVTLKDLWLTTTHDIAAYEKAFAGAGWTLKAKE